MTSLRAILAALMITTAAPAMAGDVANGSKIFKTQCGTCHRAEAGKNLIGPSMFGIVGRPSGSVTGFKYSAANQEAKLTWDVATLDVYLTNPRAKVPGTTMTFAGLKNETQRADVIAYLETLK